jgi:NSS family neurotransmitter:Na+ symporter
VLVVALSDTVVALLGGMVVFPALFSAGGTPGEGPGLVFVTLPTVFGRLPGGGGFAVALYGLLLLAAITSTISLLEVAVCYFVDERGVSRRHAAWGLTGVAALLAIPSALSQGAVPWLSGEGTRPSFLELQGLVFGNYGVIVGALGISVFVAWRWGAREAIAEVCRGGASPVLARAWFLMLAFGCPLGIVAILAFSP